MVKIEQKYFTLVLFRAVNVQNCKIVSHLQKLVNKGADI